jgi:hypothetical protein
MKSQGMESHSKDFPSVPIPYSVLSFTVVRILYFVIPRDALWKSAAFPRGLGTLSSPLQQSIRLLQNPLPPGH